MENFKFVSALDSDKKNVYLFFADEVDIDKKETTATFETEETTNNAVETLKNGSCSEHDILPVFRDVFFYHISNKLENLVFNKEVECDGVECIDSKNNHDWSALKTKKGYVIKGFCRKNFVPTNDFEDVDFEKVLENSAKNFVGGNIKITEQDVWDFLKANATGPGFEFNEKQVRDWLAENKHIKS